MHVWLLHTHLIGTGTGWLAVESRSCRASSSWAIKAATLDEAAIEEAGAVSKEVKLSKPCSGISLYLPSVWVPLSCNRVLRSACAGESQVCSIANRLPPCWWCKNSAVQLAVRQKQRRDFCTQVSGALVYRASRNYVESYVVTTLKTSLAD